MRFGRHRKKKACLKAGFFVVRSETKATVFVLSASECGNTTKLRYFVRCDSHSVHAHTGSMMTTRRANQQGSTSWNLFLGKVPATR